MDPQADGAARLLTELSSAARKFTAFGSAQWAAHRSARWRHGNEVGGGIAPLATVGVVFGLKDADDTEVCFSVMVWYREDQFRITADVTVDDPLPIPGGSSNQRYLLDLPDVRTTDLDECLSAVRDYTARLCEYTTVLDELGVPRTDHVSPAATTFAD